MLLEIIGFIGLMTLCMFYFAETQKHPALGLIGSFVLLILSFWIIGDGIQIKSGQIQFTNETVMSTTCGPENQSVCMTTNTDTLRNSTTSDTYVDAPTTPFITLQNLLGIILLMTSIYAMFHYVIAFSGSR